MRPRRAPRSCSTSSAFPTSGCRHHRTRSPTIRSTISPVAPASSPRAATPARTGRDARQPDRRTTPSAAELHQHTRAIIGNHEQRHLGTNGIIASIMQAGQRQFSSPIDGGTSSGRSRHYRSARHAAGSGGDSGRSTQSLLSTTIYHDASDNIFNSSGMSRSASSWAAARCDRNTASATPTITNNTVTGMDGRHPCRLHQLVTPAISRS